MELCRKTSQELRILSSVTLKDITAYQRLGYNSLMWYTGLPVQHGLPNPIVVCTNERTGSLSSVIAKPSYMFSHWSRPHVGLAIYAIMRGWVNCTQFQQNSLISGHVFGWYCWKLRWAITWYRNAPALYCICICVLICICIWGWVEGFDNGGNWWWPSPTILMLLPHTASPLTITTPLKLTQNFNPI